MRREIIFCRSSGKKTGSLRLVEWNELTLCSRTAGKVVQSIKQTKKTVEINWPPNQLVGWPARYSIASLTGVRTSEEYEEILNPSCWRLANTCQGFESDIKQVIRRSCVGSSRIQCLDILDKKHRVLLHNFAMIDFVFDFCSPPRLILPPNESTTYSPIKTYFLLLKSLVSTKIIKSTQPKA